MLTLLSRLKRIVSYSVLLAALAVTPFALTACGGSTGLAGAPKGGETVLSVNGEKVTKSEYDKLFNQFAKQMGADKNPELLKESFISELVKQQTIQSLVTLAIIEQEAKKRHLAVTPTDLKEQEVQVVERVGGQDKFEMLKKQHNLSDEDFNYQMRQIVIIRKLISSMPGGTITASESDVLNHYRKNISQFNVPEQVHSAHILIKASAGDLRNSIAKAQPKLDAKALQVEVEKTMAAKKKEAQALLDSLLRDPKRFEAIAASKTNEDTMAAMNKGDIGMMQERSTDPGYWAATKAAKAGALVPSLVQSSYGYHVVLVKEKQAAHQQSFEEVKGKIKGMMEEQKQNEVFGQWMQEKTQLAEKEGSIVIEAKYKSQAPQGMPPGMGGPPPAAPPAPPKH